MANPITIIAPIKLAADKTEADLLAASETFQKEFVDAQPGVIRRELVRKSDGGYLDIIQFRSKEDAETIIEKEQGSAACHAFFEVMDMTDVDDPSDAVDFCTSLATYG